MTTKIIAICGAPGAGKSGVCQALAEKLNGEIISMDADAVYTAMSPDELTEWIDAGADYNVFGMPELAEILERKNNGARPVFFESHFGRSHDQTGQYISQQIYLQLPLDLALARQLEKVSDDFIAYGVADMGQLRWFKGFLRTYQEIVAPLLIVQARHLAARADLVVDASKPLASVVAEIADYLRESG